MPVNVDQESVLPEPRPIGKRWMDFAVTATAIVMSVISLNVGVENARTQEKMVAATSRPILFYTTGNSNEEGEASISMEIRNVGIGPAFLKHIEVRHQGRSYSGAQAFVRGCCMTPEEQEQARDGAWLGMGTQRVGQTVMPAESDSLMLRLPKTERNAAVWERLNRARFQVEIDACYCSVLGECWRSDLSGLEPRQVDECPSKGGYRE
jgi:hypothetical protein